MDASQFRFRESEVESLKILLGDFGLLERTNQPSDLLLRLEAAGMVERVPFVDEFVSYYLTSEGKALVKKALG